MKKVTIKDVEHLINPNLESPKLDAETYNLIQSAHEHLRHTTNYEYQFGGTQGYWSNRKWREVAKDVAEKINN